jgi:hypothetical protein
MAWLETNKISSLDHRVSGPFPDRAPPLAWRLVVKKYKLPCPILQF